MLLISVTFQAVLNRCALVSYGPGDGSQGQACAGRRRVFPPAAAQFAAVKLKQMSVRDTRISVASGYWYVTCTLQFSRTSIVTLTSPECVGRIPMSIHCHSWPLHSLIQAFNVFVAKLAASSVHFIAWLEFVCLFRCHIGQITVPFMFSYAMAVQLKSSFSPALFA